MLSQGVQTRLLARDEAGWVESEEHPESGRAFYSYDSSSNLAGRPDVREIVAGFAYDGTGRMLHEYVGDGRSAVRYVYDFRPTGTALAIADPRGLRTRVTTTTGGVTLSHDSVCCCFSSVDPKAAAMTGEAAKSCIASYVRNDPVNLVDLDGRQWFGADEKSYCDLYPWDIASCGNFYNPWGWVDEAAALWAYTGMMGAAGIGHSLTTPGPSSPRLDGLDPRMVMEWFQIDTGLVSRIGRADSDCQKFLGALIGQLKAANLVGSEFSVDTLRSNITTYSSISLVPIYDAAGSPIRTRSSYGKVEPGTNHIMLQDSLYLSDHTYTHSFRGGRGQPTYTGDLYSTLLHEGFHLAVTSASGGSLTDRQIYDAITKTGMPYQNVISHSGAVGGTFARYCGSQ